MEDAEIDEQSHARLTASIAKLDKTQHIKAPGRSEPTASTGEFDLVKKNRLDLGAVVSVLETNAHRTDVGKTIKKTQAPEKVLAKPLEKPQAERIKRSSAFESTRKKLARWDATVARNRTVDHVSFPLKTAVNKLVSSTEFLSKFKLKSELQRELEAVDGREEVEEREEENEFPMTYEEMLEHRKELAKLRAQQSFKAAKAKRQSKIKSKKYHRILKKERMKQQLAEFEALQKTDPEEALRRLEALERTRAEERHTLRHRNTGKWAKSKLVRAKYNPEVRQQLADQLAVSRNLTQKVQQADNSSDDESEQEETIPDLPVSNDPSNPWMAKTARKSKIEEDFDFGYKKYIKENFNQDDSSTENDDVDKDSVNESLQDKDIILISDNNENVTTPVTVDDNNIINPKKSKSKIVHKKSKLKVKTIATSEWIVESIEMDKYDNHKTSNNLSKEFDNLEENISMKIQEKISKLREDIEKVNTKTTLNKKQKHLEEDNLSKLEFKNKKTKPIIDSEMDETIHKHPNSEHEYTKPLTEIAVAATNRKENESAADVDPTKFVKVKPKYLATALSENDDGFNNLDEEQVVPKVNIEEVFEEDDVVASFRQEKEEEINKDKPLDIDLSLPGWGNWGGKGVRAPKRKRSRFILKAPPKFPRRDENKGDIIIREFKDVNLAAHRVKELPFPFTSVKDFEASIRAPLGNTFVPEKAHRKLIKPSVFTKAGTIIDPIDDEELLKPRNQNFRNEAIIKLLAKK